LVVAAIVGVIAAVLPARRAARVNILDAIHYE
jgi:putative ABC transport system permease protein